MENLKERTEVRRFAQAMEKILQKNDHKGGWDKDSFKWLFSKLIEEVGEVGKEITDNFFVEGAVYTNQNIDNLCNELVDVANVAMMMWDKLKTLKDRI